MGNSLGRKKCIKIMKIDGQTMKLKTPLKAFDVLKDYPGLVLIDSEAVKHYGSRAKPLEPYQVLQPNRLYFLIELPKFPKENLARMASSGINMSAKERLESLMLVRRSASDLSIIRQASIIAENSRQDASGPLRLKMRLPRAEVDKMIKESKDEAEAVEKIMRLCVARNDNGIEGHETIVAQEEIRHVGNKQKKRVSFPAISKGEIQIIANS